MPKKLTTEEFINRALVVHGSLYNYTDTVYVDSNTLVKVNCTEHGKVLVHPQSFLKGSGCKKCGHQRARQKNSYDSETFIEKAKQQFSYNFSKVRYIDSKTKVELICHKHGSFFQRPADLLMGHGCQECAYETRTATKIKNGTIIHPDHKCEFAKYTCDVWKHTSTSYRKFRSLIKNSDKERSREWHLDHIFSIYDGFQNGVDPKVIGHHSNLQLISQLENITKNTQSWKSLEELYEGYSISRDGQ